MEEVEGHVSTVVLSLPFSDEMLKLIVEETAKDDELQRVIVCLQQGWIKGKCPQYFPMRAELSVCNSMQLLQKDELSFKCQCVNTCFVGGVN